jgi:hemerythrin
MAFVDWSDKYSVNDREMDEHHQRLFAIVNDLHKAILAKKGKEEIGRTLDRLNAHTQSHFAAEERLMQAHGYPRYQEHKNEHERLLHQVGDMEREFRNSSDHGAPDVLAFLIKDWLVGHILGMDKDYALSLRSTARRAARQASHPI